MSVPEVPEILMSLSFEIALPDAACVDPSQLLFLWYVLCSPEHRYISVQPMTQSNELMPVHNENQLIFWYTLCVRT